MVWESLAWPLAVVVPLPSVHCPPRKIAYANTTKKELARSLPINLLSRVRCGWHIRIAMPRAVYAPAGDGWKYPV